MLDLGPPNGQRHRPTRRAIVGAAAWATPAVLLATAAPAAAASLPACKPVQLTTDWTSASYVRISATTGTYTWVNPLGNGSIPLLTLTIAATSVGPTFTSLGSSDLVGTAGPTGGQSVPGLNLALNKLKDTTSTTTTGADYVFTFSGAVTNVAFSITDIDGGYFGGNSNNAGSERVTLSSPSAITGAIVDSRYLTGTGVSGDPWRRRPNSVPATTNLTNNSSDGNVSVTSAALSQFTLGWRTLDNTAPNAANEYNIWLTPITFTLLCP